MGDWAPRGRCPMPWRETSPMDQRRLFINDYRHSVFPFAELCARYGISRKTGYKWIARHGEGGYPALADRSRRPHACAHRTPVAVEQALVEVRRHHPFWGAKKLLRLCRKRQPELAWPARSTTCAILKRNGLITERRRRRPQGHPGRPMTPMNAPNEIWTASWCCICRAGWGRAAQSDSGLPRWRAPPARRGRY